MKTKLLLPIVLFLFFSINLYSQTTWNGSGGDINWDNTGNWNTNVLPSGTDDVIIPGGFTVTLNTVANIKSIELQGNSVLNIISPLHFSDTATFEANTTVNWVDSSISGILLNSLGTLNLITTNDKAIESASIINNSGTINMVGSGDLVLQDGSILNNQASGIIDMQADTGNISQAGGASVLNNSGLILRTTTTGEARIELELNNNGGIIQVESGVLSFFSFVSKNLTGGIYNVAPGTILDWDSPISLSGVLAGIIDGTLNWNNNVGVPISSTLDFTGSGNFNWTGGALNGGGVLTNQSTLDLITISDKPIQEDTTLNNSGIINIVDAGNLYITQGIVNNQASGIIDLQANEGNITRSGGTSNILNNIGLIKRTSTAGIARIDNIELNNNDGVIQIENGVLSFDGVIGENLTDGVYNVSSGAVLDWDNLVSLSGNITGVIDGALNWNNTVSVPVSATLNFTGSGNVNWSLGTLNGGGILTNQSTLNLTTIGVKVIQEDTSLNNSGIINIVDTGDLFINQGVVNNQASGIIDMQANEGSITRSGGTSNVLNNTGIIKRTTTTATARIFVELNNSGTIEVETGELEIANSLPFTNEINGVIKGNGVFDLPTIANYTNDGIFAPGSSPGTLTVDGDYKSTTNSVLDIELNGLIQGTEYDLLAINGNADFDGDVQITLGFDPDVNDEFIVVTTTNTINTCDLPSIKTVDYNGSQYELSITCRNNNELVITVTNVTLGLNDFEHDNASITLYPNPTIDVINFSSKKINKIEVYDISGRLVLRSKTNSISMRNLPSGAYLVKGIDSNNFTITKKIIRK